VRHPNHAKWRPPANAPTGLETQFRILFVVMVLIAAMALLGTLFVE